MCPLDKVSSNKSGDLCIGVAFKVCKGGNNGNILPDKIIILSFLDLNLYSLVIFTGFKRCVRDSGSSQKSVKEKLKVVLRGGNQFHFRDIKSLRVSIIKLFKKRINIFSIFYINRIHFN